MSIKKELQQGALVNFMGVAGKIAGPAFLVLVTRFYGPDLFGIFVTANLLIEISIAFLTAGFKDGSLIFVARYADRKEDRPLLYRSLANALAWSMGLASLLLILTITVVPAFLGQIYSGDFANELIPLLLIMVFALPLMAFERMTLSATQGLKIMKYEAMISGWIRPIILLTFVISFYPFYPNIYGLGIAFIFTQICVVMISIWVYNLELSWIELSRAFRDFKLNMELLKFSIPQNFNLTLTRFITGLDVLMLPAFGFSAAAVGFYAAGAMIVRELRNIKLMFSTAFAPFIVRLHRAGQLEALSKNFSMSSNWVASIAIPAILSIAILRNDLLLLVHPDYTDSTMFMLFLLPVPFFYNSFGLAGNIVTMTGHSTITLMNSTIVLITNFLLNLLFIPMYGLIGAALASAIAACLLSILELTEARYIVGVKLLLSRIFLPYLLGIVFTILLWLLQLRINFMGEDIMLRVGITLTMIAAFGGILYGVHRAGLYRVKHIRDS